MADVASRGRLLHQAVQKRNIDMIHNLIRIKTPVNEEDDNSCSPLYYALLNGDKSIIRMLMLAEARVIAPIQDLFSLFIKNLKEHNCDFFMLLYHMEFKTSLKLIMNDENRSVAHIAAALRANRCLGVIRDKFNVPMNQPDIYDKTAQQYLSK